MWNIKHPDNIYIYSFGSQCELWCIHRLYHYVYFLGINLMTSALIALPECKSELLDDTCNLFHICFSECSISWSCRKTITHHHSQLTNVRRLTAHLLPSLNERFVCFYSSIIKLFLSLITRMLIKTFNSLIHFQIIQLLYYSCFVFSDTILIYCMLF